MLLAEVREVMLATITPPRTHLQTHRLPTTPTHHHNIVHERRRDRPSERRATERVALRMIDGRASGRSTVERKNDRRSIERANYIICTACSTYTSIWPAPVGCTYTRSMIRCCLSLGVAFLMNENKIKNRQKICTW